MSIDATAVAATMRPIATSSAPKSVRNRGRWMNMKNDRPCNRFTDAARMRGRVRSGTLVDAEGCTAPEHIRSRSCFRPSRFHEGRFAKTRYRPRKTTIHGA